MLSRTWYCVINGNGLVDGRFKRTVGANNYSLLLLNPFSIIEQF